MGKKKAQLPPISIFVGRCDRRKYETTARVLGKLVSEKYSSDVQYVHRVKRLPRNIEVCNRSYCPLVDC